jgi:hypothetical protein
VGRPCQISLDVFYLALFFSFFVTCVRAPVCGSRAHRIRGVRLAPPRACSYGQQT